MIIRKASYIVIPLLILVLVMIPIKVLSSNPPTDLVQSLQQQTEGSVRISYHAETGMVRFIGTDPSHPIPQPGKITANTSDEDAAKLFLISYGSLFGLSDPNLELTVMGVQAADQGHSFVRFQQVYNTPGSPAIPVMGGELIVQLSEVKDVVSVSGEILPDIKVNPIPTINLETAQQYAIDSVARDYGISVDKLTATKPELWVYNPALLGASGVPLNTLVWRMEVTDLNAFTLKELVLVDAHLGVVALHFSEIDTVKNRKIYDNENNAAYGLPGPNLKRSEGGLAIGIADVDKAYEYAGDTYDFYWTNHNRDSLDGAGMALVSTVRYCSPTSTCPYPNAYWNGSQMVYGQGYALAADVVGHEMTHGVTDHESRLFYYMQSGAINESFSDIWGEFIDRTYVTTSDDWLMGEALPIGAIRSMSDPTLYGQPDKMSSSNYFCGSWSGVGDDNGGVHTNSGVGNKAAYLMVAGGVFNGKTITPLPGGMPEVAKIFYEVQTHMLTSAGDYADLNDNLQQTCTNLIGSGVTTTADCQQVKNALDAVEMGQQPAGCQAPEAPVCPSGQGPVDLFFDNLENPASGNWAHAAYSGSDQWFYPQNSHTYSFDATYATSGQFNFWGYDYEVSSDYYIALTKNIAITSGSTPYLHFSHAYDFEAPNYDGGVIEYSTNSGVTWSDAGSLITNNGYSGTISSSANNPLKGRQGFVGYTSGYISSRLDLSSLVGQNVRFRFRIGTDTGGWGYGWFIDDIRVYTCSSTPPTATTTPPGMKSINLPIVRRGGANSTPTPTSTSTPPSQSWEIVVNTTFEGDFPGAWDVYDNDVPPSTNGEYFWATRNCMPYAGTNSGWAVGGGANGNGLSCGSNYPVNADSWMVYGPFSLVNATAAELDFKLWADTEMSYDKVCRYASIDGLYFYGTCTSGNSAGWIDRILDLTNVYTLGDLRGQPQVWVAIVFSSDYGVNYPEGAYVDNIVLRRCMSPTCTGINTYQQENGNSQIIEKMGQATIHR